MANKMLIDATHPEETRVVVLRGNRVEEFDFEAASRRQLRGNIYLAKVTRVEPSLQAAFVDYGGNRHGFLAFSEIHPDYYQIPVADRQALIDEEERAHRDAEAEADRRAGMRRRPQRPPRHRAAGRHTETVASEPIEGDVIEHGEGASSDHASDAAPQTHAGGDYQPETGERRDDAGHADHPEHAAATDDHAEAPPYGAEHAEESRAERHAGESDEHAAGSEHDGPHIHADDATGHRDHDEPGHTAGTDLEEAEERHQDEDGNGDAAEGEEEEIVESVGGDDAMEEVPDRAPRYRRQYKIQEVIKRRQIMLVQVVKEERGTKGAALTTYLSLACLLYTSPSPTRPY